MSDKQSNELGMTAAGLLVVSFVCAIGAAYLAPLSSWFTLVSVLSGIFSVGVAIGYIVNRYQ